MRVCECCVGRTRGSWTVTFRWRHPGYLEPRTTTCPCDYSLLWRSYRTESSMTSLAKSLLTLCVTVGCFTTAMTVSWNPRLNRVSMGDLTMVSEGRPLELFQDRSDTYAGSAPILTAHKSSGVALDPLKLVDLTHLVRVPDCTTIL